MMNAREQREWRVKNPQKASEYNKKYKKKHPEKVKEGYKKYRKNNNVKIKEYRDKDINKDYQKEYQIKKYNITLEEYNTMLEEQDYKCAICGKEKSENGKSFAVDHNHKTGETRGLLCNNCNVGIGFFKDSAEITAKATAYLINNK